MGVWIEISLIDRVHTVPLVTPCMGVWIEMCGVRSSPVQIPVTPCMGVWIEITYQGSTAKERNSHSLYGSVD